MAARGHKSTRSSTVSLCQSRSAHLQNTAGALPGVLGVCWAAGVALDATGSWALALFPSPTAAGAAAQLLGALVFSLFGSCENQGWDNDGEQ